MTIIPAITGAIILAQNNDEFRGVRMSGIRAIISATKNKRKVIQPSPSVPFAEILIKLDFITIQGKKVPIIPKMDKQMLNIL
jgi:hypothetical protein